MNVAATTIIFVADLQLEHGFVGGVPYVLVVMLSAALGGVASTLGFAGAATLLTLLGYLWSPPGGDAWKAIVNRLLAVVVVWMVALEVVHRKRLATVRAEAAKQIRSIIEASPSAMLLVDADGCITRVNAAAERLFGYTREEILGQRVEILMPLRYRDRHPSLRAKFATTGTPLQVGSGRLIYALRKNGREVPVEIRLALFPTKRGPFVMSTITDITESTQRETIARAQMAARAREAAQEAERRRLAREIHDALGQAVTALKLDIAWLLRHLPVADARLRARAQAAEDLAQTTIDRVRGLAAELRPAILDDCGLHAALRWQVDEFQRHTAIACTLALPPTEIAWDEGQSTVVFRILQEALTNVARHAGATRVAVTLHEENGAGILTVEDNGRGVTADEAARPEALGVRGMQERAALHGGHLTLTGAAGRGTTVVVRMPRPAGHGAVAGVDTRPKT